MNRKILKKYYTRLYINKNKLDIIYFLLLFFYFTYCTTYNWNKPDLASGFALASIIYIIFKVLPNKLKAVINIPITIIMFAWGFSTSYIHSFGIIPIETGTALMQTNLSELVSYIRAMISLNYLIICSISILISILSFYINQLSKTNIAIAVYFVLSCIIIYSNKASILKPYGNYKQIISSIKQYSANIDAYGEVLKKRSEILKTYNLTSNYNGTIIFVIGESETSALMSDYGFYLNDTPNTGNRKDVIKYSDVITTYPQTVIAVPDMLTLGDNNHNVSYADVKSYDIISVLKEVGMHSYWISASEEAFMAKEPISEIASNSDVSFFIPSIQSQKHIKSFDDGLTIPYIESIMQNKNYNKIIFVHLYGSHVYYIDRYPKEFDKFHYSDFVNKKFYGKLKDHYDINNYISSIYYTDYLLNKIFNIADNATEPVVVYYHSDHGESPVNNKVHNGDNGSIYSEHYIPMYLHFNKKFIKEYPELYKNATANEDKPYYTLYDPYTIFDLVGLRDKNGNVPEFENRTKSIFSKDYKAENRIVSFSGFMYTPDKYNINNDYYENTHALMMALRGKYNNNVTDNIYANDVSSLGGLIEAKPLFYGVSTKILLGDKNYGALICNAKDECDYNLTISEYLQASKGFLRKPDLHLLFFIENNSTINDNNNWVANLQKAITDNKIDVHNIKFVAYNADVKSKFLNALKSSEFDNEFNNDSVGIENSNGVINFGDGEKIKIRADINSSDENFLSLFPLETHTSLVVSYPSMM